MATKVKFVHLYSEVFYSKPELNEIYLGHVGVVWITAKFA